MSSNVVRWGGVAGVVAAGMWVLSFILIQLTSLPRVFESFSDYLIEVILLVGYVGTIGAIVGLHVLQSQSERLQRQSLLGSHASSPPSLTPTRTGRPLELVSHFIDRVHTQTYRRRSR